MIASTLDRPSPALGPAAAAIARRRVTRRRELMRASEAFAKYLEWRAKLWG